MADDDGPTGKGPRIGLSGAPPTSQVNGWLTILDHLISDDGYARRRMAVIEYDVLRRVHESDTGQVKPIIRIRQVEVCESRATGPDEPPQLYERAAQLLDDAEAERTGQRALIPPHGED